MMPDNARGKGREPNGKQCLRRKGMKKNKKCREAYHKRKNQQLHRNDSHHAHSIDDVVISTQLLGN
jgi:hypothetical protein